MFLPYIIIVLMLNESYALSILKIIKQAKSNEAALQLSISRSVIKKQKRKFSKSETGKGESII